MVSLINSNGISAAVNFCMPVRFTEAFTVLLWNALCLNGRTGYLNPRLKKDLGLKKKLTFLSKNVKVTNFGFSESHWDTLSDPEPNLLHLQSDKLIISNPSDGCVQGWLFTLPKPSTVSSYNVYTWAHLLRIAPHMINCCFCKAFLVVLILSAIQNC